MNKIRAYPSELRCILTFDTILKIGVGIVNDAQVIWEDLRTDANHLVDVGLMAKLWNIDKHQEEDFTPLNLGAAASEVLNITVDKVYQKDFDWKGDLNSAHRMYAALNAAVSLRLYEKLRPALESKEMELGKAIPSQWFSFNARLGEPTRRMKSVRGVELPWSTRDCTWYSVGKFQGCQF
ncbi:hypothetical protein C8F04DRAFT_1279756 [Mycena alexandri]|uniref:3'-5' exonuclease domain-containing protein n=1 Tax=Mycena alexandri TaxID=1745969 RepID=A0AAD6RXN7_9AGAR|nr:hypothetical protein C8F04DRAFT_1279756 [Mycena alexandri]